MLKKQAAGLYAFELKPPNIFKTPYFKSLIRCRNLHFAWMSLFAVVISMVWTRLDHCETEIGLLGSQSDLPRAPSGPWVPCAPCPLFRWRLSLVIRLNFGLSGASFGNWLQMVAGYWPRPASFDLGQIWDFRRIIEKQQLSSTLFL